VSIKYPYEITIDVIIKHQTQRMNFAGSSQYLMNDHKK
jgi:hypothetical protein